MALILDSEWSLLTDSNGEFIADSVALPTYASTDSDDHQLFATTISTASDLAALTYAAGAIGDYDWSGMSLRFTRGAETSNLPCCTLISDTHGVCARHAGHLGTDVTAGDVYSFRAPDGSVATGTVEAKTTITGDIALIRFTANPSVALARYPILLNQEDMEGRTFWAPEHNCEARLREGWGIFSVHFNHIDGGWGGPVQSSGRPCVVPLSDGSLAIMGTHSSSFSFERLDDQIDLIQAELALHSEAADTVEAEGAVVPDPVLPGSLQSTIRSTIHRTVRSPIAHHEST